MGSAMADSSAECFPLTSSEHILIVRQAVRRKAVDAGFSLVEQTKIVTAASELARNTLLHGGRGQATGEVIRNGPRNGVRPTFEDKGPGIRDLTLAMRDGYSTSGGLGLGLSGAKRLSNEFEIETAPGAGTRIVIA